MSKWRLPFASVAVLNPHYGVEDSMDDYEGRDGRT